jgi:hypothetical protein
MNLAIKKYIGDIITKCQENDRHFKLVGLPYLRYAGGKCSGYCDHTGLTVAIKKDLKEWILVLIHEDAHLDQLLEESPLWFNEFAETNDIEVWVKNKRTRNNRIDKFFEATIALELDCEKRSVEKIKKYKLPVNVEEYIRKSNAYLFSYMITRINRRWFEFPYRIPQIYEKMPNKFLNLKDYLNKNHPLLSLYNYELINTIKL